MSKILIENCNVIDGMGNAPRRGVDVLVDGNRIASVEPSGEGGERNGSAATLRIDAKGKTVMPGLIDAHCHMTYGEPRAEDCVTRRAGATGPGMSAEKCGHRRSLPRDSGPRPGGASASEPSA